MGQGPATHRLGHLWQDAPPFGPLFPVRQRSNMPSWGGRHEAKRVGRSPGWVIFTVTVSDQPGPIARSIWQERGTWAPKASENRAGERLEAETALTDHLISFL